MMIILMTVIRMIVTIMIYIILLLYKSSCKISNIDFKETIYWLVCCYETLLSPWVSPKCLKMFVSRNTHRLGGGMGCSLPSRELTYPTLGRGKNHLQIYLGSGYVLVPRRVHNSMAWNHLSVVSTFWVVGFAEGDMSVPWRVIPLQPTSCLSGQFQHLRRRSPGVDTKHRWP